MSSIDYDLKKIHGVVFDIDGVLSPATIPTDRDGEPLRMVNLRDGYAMQYAVKHGLKIAIITGAVSQGMQNRYNRLGITDYYSGSNEKAEILTRWMAENDLTPEQVAYAGDDIPDYEPMRIVGLPVAPADASPDIKSIAHYISPAEGGYGVARDLLQQILLAQGLWIYKSKAFGW